MVCLGWMMHCLYIYVSTAVVALLEIHSVLSRKPKYSAYMKAVEH